MSRIVEVLPPRRDEHRRRLRVACAGCTRVYVASIDRAHALRLRSCAGCRAQFNRWERRAPTSIRKTLPRPLTRARMGFT